MRQRQKSAVFVILEKNGKNAFGTRRMMCSLLEAKESQLTESYRFLVGILGAIGITGRGIAKLVETQRRINADAATRPRCRPARFAGS